MMQIEINLDAPETEIERVLLKQCGNEFVLAPGVKVEFRCGVLAHRDYVYKERKENNYTGPTTKAGVVKRIYVLDEFRKILIQYESDYSDLGENWSELHTTDLYWFARNVDFAKSLIV